MKGILLLNGEPYLGLIDCENAVVYCCDGAYDWAKDRVRIDKNIGDFDSVKSTPFPPPEEVYPSEKNFTDGELAIKKMLSSGIDEIEIYGAGGGREDHFLGNLQIAYLAHMCGAICKIYTNSSIIFPASGKIKFDGFLGKTISVLPFGGKIHILSYEGLKYAYPEYIGYGECRGISNVVEDENACLCVEGCALVIINLGEV